VAIVFEADDGEVKKVTYKELLSRVSQFANGLRARGIKKGDRVVIYMSMGVEGIIAMQACARIGAIHSVVFGGFSAQSVRDRVNDAGAVAVITADEQCRGGKKIPLKPAVDDGIALGGCESVKTVIVFQRTGGACHMVPGRDVWWHDVIAGQSDVCEPEWVGAEHPLFLLYTSGSTGKPKGVQHSTGGYLLHAIVTMKWTFRPQAGRPFLVHRRHRLGYRPHLHHLWTTCLRRHRDGLRRHPDLSGCRPLLEDDPGSQGHIFYTAPTAIRSLIKAADTNPAVAPTQYDLSSLRLLGTVGEPINPAAWQWYYDSVGGSRCPIVDTFWQTETGGHMITPLPGVTPLVPGSCTLPFPGIQAAVVDETGTELDWGKGGLLVVKRPWPAMIRNIWGDPERFKKSYYPDDFNGKLYLAGDGSIRDINTGYFTITGRIDDVLNVSGHRMGTMEIESALVSHPMVAEAAVVGRPDDLTGEAICAFVVLKGPRPVGEAAKKMIKELQDHVGREIGPIAKPKDLRFGENLPKTRSGKIMRRLLRSLAKGETVAQDVSTLENPAILEQLRG
jgi:acetyl-CoA synthetase